MATSYTHLLRNPLHFLSLGMGSGLAPKAPGTVGSVAALVIYYLLLQGLSLPVYLAVVAMSIVVGIYLCGYTAKAMGLHDAPAIVWDEFAGLWLALVLLPPQWYWPLIGFVLFRFFDILKPWPISLADKKVHGGLGIMMDDVLAGIMAAIVMHLLLLVFDLGSLTLQL